MSTREIQGEVRRIIYTTNAIESLTALCARRCRRLPGFDDKVIASKLSKAASAASAVAAW